MTDFIQITHGAVKAVEYHNGPHVSVVAYPEHLRPIRWFVEVSVDGGLLSLGDFENYGDAFAFAQRQSSGWGCPIKHVAGTAG